jgi:acetolactate synthase-1/3 small subunit
MMDRGSRYCIFEVTGDEDMIDVLLERLDPFGIKKLARSGVLALYREP